MLLVRMPFFITFGQREQNFISKILQVGEGKRAEVGRLDSLSTKFHSDQNSMDNNQL